MHLNILIKHFSTQFATKPLITHIKTFPVVHGCLHKHACINIDCFQRAPAHIYTTTRAQPQLHPHIRSPGKAPAELKHPVAYPLGLGHGMHWMTLDYFLPTNLSLTASGGGDATQPFLLKSRCAQTTMKESSYLCS